MEQARFDLKLPLRQRRELDALSGETGLSRADLVRLGIRYMLEHPELFMRPLESEGSRHEL
jgi:hypothetical protein